MNWISNLLHHSLIVDTCSLIVAQQAHLTGQLQRNFLKYDPKNLRGKTTSCKFFNCHNKISKMSFLCTTLVFSQMSETLIAIIDIVSGTLQATQCSSFSRNGVDFSEITVNQGWIKNRLPVLFRIDSFKTQIDYRQFQKILLVIDSFGPNRCGKYGLKSFGILGFSPHTHLSLLNIESTMQVDDILRHCLKNIDLCFWKFW